MPKKKRPVLSKKATRMAQKDMVRGAWKRIEGKRRRKATRRTRIFKEKKDTPWVIRWQRRKNVHELLDEKLEEILVCFMAACRTRCSRVDGKSKLTPWTVRSYQRRRHHQ